MRAFAAYGDKSSHSTGEWISYYRQEVTKSYEKPSIALMGATNRQHR